MSENQSEPARYVDPNSGAAPQPGGFAVGAPVAADAPSADQAEPKADGADQAEPTEVDEPAEVEDGGSEEDGAKDYSDLLSGSVGDVEKYVEAHPEERDAIVEAEQQGKARKGILEL